MEFESNKSLWLSQVVVHTLYIIESTIALHWFYSQGGVDDSNLLHEKFTNLIETEVERRLEAEVEMRAERERQERDLMLLEKEQELERLRVKHEREMYLIKKKLSVVNTSSPVKQPAPVLSLAIPSYRTVGVGKTSYVEYEVSITEPAAEEVTRWSVFRRYRQFRDLHSTLSTNYGHVVTSLPFPSRKLFGSRSDAVSSERQRDLQSYLNNLILTCSKVSSCPLRSGLSRENLYAFSSFFQTNNAESTET